MTLKIHVAESDIAKEQAFRIRFTVFVDEQKVPAALEIDEHENDAIHFVGYENGQAIGASRIRFVDDVGKLERICILKEHRGKQYGKKLIKAMETTIRQHHYDKTKLHAQTHAEEFYRSLGYQTVSEPFMDAGIPHVAMIKNLS